ncbi:MAG TPA: rod-binding protein [Sphingomonas sp.]|nr:rod-binding protein [Sphingomonas sp.]
MVKLKKTAQQFEAVFLRQLIGSMRTASLGDGIFDSEATKQFRDMSDAKTADTMAGRGALGIADLLVKQYGARLAPNAVPGVVPATPDAKASK